MRLAALIPQILFFGDTIVQESVKTPGGIIPQVQNVYVGKYDVVNRGFSGYTTYDALQIDDAVYTGLSSAPLEWTVLCFGTDELAQGNLFDSFFVAVNLLSLTGVALENGKNVVIVGPGIVNEDLVNGTNSDYYELSQQAKQIAETYDVPYIDMWSIFRTFLNEDPNRYDDWRGGFEALGSVPAANVTFGSSANQSAFNISALYANGTNTTNSSSSGVLNGSTICTYSEGNVTVGVSNGTNGTDCSFYFYTYIGEKGNPKNFLLNSLLTDGVHYTDLAYDLWLDALLPILNLTSPRSALPDYSEINSTEVLPSAIAEEYVSAAIETAEDYLGVVSDLS